MLVCGVGNPATIARVRIAEGVLVNRICGVFVRRLLTGEMLPALSAPSLSRLINI